MARASERRGAEDVKDARTPDDTMTPRHPDHVCDARNEQRDLGVELRGDAVAITARWFSRMEGVRTEAGPDVRRYVALSSSNVAASSPIASR